MLRFGERGNEQNDRKACLGQYEVRFGCHSLLVDSFHLKKIDEYKELLLAGQITDRRRMGCEKQATVLVSALLLITAHSGLPRVHALPSALPIDYVIWHSC